MLNLVDRAARGGLDAEVALVIASRECPGAERALARGIPTLRMAGEIPRETLGRVLRDHGAEWIVLAGYLRLLQVPPGFERRAVNIHPALLPSFGGPGMYGERVHRAVLEAGCKVSGCTVHLCDEAYDRGPIVAQRCCEVREDDSPESLGARVFALESELYPWALQRLLRGQWSIEGGRVRMIESRSG
ncbi:MAG TPA: phosphoribosylglycinamide formyltransferase [Phycisphaerales bacterium]|nr:phosphoribosylglycinamide formyltransferase [Phycisphaerales bacterium]